MSMLGSGSLDSNPADEMPLNLLNSEGVNSDWLVPYDGSGGVNDIQGAC